MVETGPNWCVEAVWAGPFEAADFDRTDLMFGTGIRARGDHLMFVNSGTAVDRLISTSLAFFTAVSLAVMAVAGLARGTP